jgi:hypothetical protein
MHAVIYRKGTNKIHYVVKNCIRQGRKFVGDNMKVGVNLKLFDVMWTEDDINPIMNQEDEIVEWDRDVSDLTPSTNITEVIKPTKADFITAMKMRKLIDNLTYQELENYVETNITDLASAKDFLKTLAKVTLALCKIVDTK